MQHYYENMSKSCFLRNTAGYCFSGSPPLSVLYHHDYIVLFFSCYSAPLADKLAWLVVPICMITKVTFVICSGLRTATCRCITWTLTCVVMVTATRQSTSTFSRRRFYQLYSQQLATMKKHTYCLLRTAYNLLSTSLNDP